MHRPLALAATLAVVAVAAVAAAITAASDAPARISSPVEAPSGSRGASPASAPETPATPRPTAPPPTATPAMLGEPWGTVDGLLQFRGNPTHTFYGRGPVPAAPEVAWRYPDRPLCTDEVVGQRTEPVVDPSGQPVLGEDGTPLTSPVPEIKRWCGTGWTGQPVVWERPDGVTELIVGAYDGAVHFLDVASGQPTRPAFRTGDIIKGSVTLDPDGFPLLYAGSRDNHLRVIALDRDEPTELWRLGPHPRRVWNNDWDGNPSVVDGVLYVGGEDSWFYAIDLNRAHDDQGRVTVDPEILVTVPGWTDQLVRDVGDHNVSIESSVAIHEHRAYFVNSGGRVVGLDLTRVRAGEAPVVFDYWVGDDADASIVVDPDGSLYVAVELERKTARARSVGQLVKLDPDRVGDPRIWGVAIPPRDRPGLPPDAGGSWATPALFGDVLYLTTHPGELLAVDANSGDVLYREAIGYHEWSSPVVVEDAGGSATLVVALCEQGGLRAYDLTDPAQPQARWTLRLPTGACIESTPAVWRGGIYVGARDGHLYGVRDP